METQGDPNTGEPPKMAPEKSYCSVSICWMESGMGVPPLSQEGAEVLFLAISSFRLVYFLKQSTQVL